MDREQFEHLHALRRQYCKRIAGMTGTDTSSAHRTAVAFAAMRARQCSAPVLDNLERLIEQIHSDEAQERALTRLLKASDLAAIRRMSTRYTEEQLQAYILFCTVEDCPTGDDRCTPQGLALLCASLLGAEEGQTVADLCCGTGGFLVNAFPVLGEGAVAAFEKDRDTASAALLRASLLGETYRVLCRDILRYPSAARFDRIFLHPSIEEQKDKVEYSGAPDAVGEDVPELSQMTGAWLYIGEAVRMLKPDGRLLVLLPASALGQVVDRTIRESYIRRGLVESVILLPTGLVLETGVPLALVSLSEGNASVRMIDAREMVAHRGRQHFLDEENRRRILDAAAGAECDESVVCSMEQLQEADWSLLPSRYTNPKELQNAMPLASVATRIERGAQLSMARLQELRSEVPTQYRYLRIANIEDGVVNPNESAEYLTAISDAAKSRCIREGTVVLSRLGTPSYKSGVACVEEDDYVVAPGNVYLIDLNTEVMDPYFLQAFLQSDVGVASLRRLGGTSAVRPIALADLRRMPVPVPPMEVQKEIAKKYREISGRCVDLRTKLRSERSTLGDVYDEYFAAE